jgi:SNF2 family DNA or RNA helicase
VIDLYDFQREDVDKLDGVVSVLIGNEMGTGKTYEAIERDLRIRTNLPAIFTGPKRTLVVAPLTVLPSWKEHYEELTDLPVTVIDPKGRERSFRQYLATKDGVFICHWDALRLLIKMPEFASTVFLHVIADECHRAKNRTAQQTKALKKIKCTNRTAMSGTPVVNRPDELWSILNWLYPREYSSYWKFYNEYVNYEIVYPQGFRKVVGPKNVAQLQRRLEPFFVRRLKKDVLKDLPDKYYTTLWVDLDPKQRKAYDLMKEEMIAWVGEHEDQPLVAPVVIAQLIRLQQFAAGYMEDNEEGGWRLGEPSSKLDALMQLLEDNPDEQFVVFSQFKQLIRLANARLSGKGILFGTLTGDTPQSTRGDVVRRFQNGDTQVFTGTIGAGGIGITLTSSSTVVFLDRSWSPATNAQAEDRLHRIGQKNAVQVIDIMARSTVDLGRKQKLEEKWSWIRQLLGDEVPLSV